MPQKSAKKAQNSVISTEKALSILAETGGVFTRAEALSILEEAITREGGDIAADGANIRSAVGQAFSELQKSGKLVPQGKNGKHAVSNGDTPIAEKPTTEKKSPKKTDAPQKDAIKSEKKSPSKGGKTANGLFKTNVGALLRPAVGYSADAQVSFAPGKRAASDENSASSVGTARSAEALKPSVSERIVKNKNVEKIEKTECSPLFDRAETLRDEYALRVESLLDDYNYELKRLICELLGVLPSAVFARICADVAVKIIGGYVAVESMTEKNGEQSVKLSVENEFGFDETVVLLCKNRRDADEVISADDVKTFADTLSDNGKGAVKGIYITNVRFSDTRHQDNKKNDGSRKTDNTRRVDGDRLAALMIKYHIGMRSDINSAEHTSYSGENEMTAIDRGYFQKSE